MRPMFLFYFYLHYLMEISGLSSRMILVLVEVFFFWGGLFLFSDGLYLWLSHSQLTQWALSIQSFPTDEFPPAAESIAISLLVLCVIKINPTLLFRFSRSSSLDRSLIQSVSLFRVISKFHYYSSYFCTYIINGSFWLNKYLLMFQMGMR